MSIKTSTNKLKVTELDFDYIKEELNNTTLTIDSQVGNEDNCISIYNTYQFN